MRATTTRKRFPLIPFPSTPTGDEKIANTTGKVELDITALVVVNKMIEMATIAETRHQAIGLLCLKSELFLFVQRCLLTRHHEIHFEIVCRH